MPILNMEMKKCVIYARYSSTKQDNSFSIEEQIAACQQKAQFEKFDIVRTFEERATSAKDLNRPILAELINFVCSKKNDIDAVFVYDISRLSRNAVDLGLIKRDFAKHGILISSVNGVINDTLESNMMQDVIARFSQYDNELRAVKVKGGMYARFKNGYALRLLRGYKWGKDANGRSILVPDETFPIYQKLWHKIRDEKLNIRQATEYINKMIPGANIYQQNLSRIFNNKGYYGVLSYPAYKEEVKANHKPMVDEDTFWQVREIITGRKRAKIKTRNKVNPLYPLTKILFCPSCEARVTAAASKGAYYSYGYYFCRDRKKCKYNNRAKFVHDAFLLKLESLIPTDEMLQFMEEMIREKYQSTVNDLTLSSSDVEKEITKLTEKKATLLDKLLDKTLTDEDYKAAITKCDAEITARKVLLSEKKIDRLDIEAVIEFIRFYLKNVHKIWERYPIEIKLALQSSTFPQGVYYENKVCRTPEISLAFRTKEVFESKGGPKNAYVELSNDLMQEYISLYKQMNPLMQSYQEVPTRHI